jgi:hypothetical protein
MSCGISGRILSLLTVATLAIATAGCAPTAGSVSGKVAVGGKPVTAGQVSFVAKTGMVYTANIEVDGSYKVDGVPPGEMTVLVIGPPPPKSVPAGRTDAAKKFSSATPTLAATVAGPTVSAKYGDMSTSDLRYTVKSGANSYDPQLK